MQSLIVIQGAAHLPYELRESPVRIGCHPDNEIVLGDDPEVSGMHCRLDLDERGRWILKDQESTNGTFLNDGPIRVARLQSGDRLRLGQTVLLFIDRTASRARGEASRVQNLLVLQEVNKALNSETDLSRLLELIMDMAIHLTQAQRGFLVLARGKQLTFKVARNIGYEAIESPEFKISNSVIKQVVESGQPVLSSDAQVDLGFHSIVTQDVRSLLCVPLRVKRKILGTLYVDSQQQAVTFTEQDKELLSAFSDQAAIALENARLLKQTKETEAMRSELRVASRIQLALLPREDPEARGYEVSGRMIAAKEVGGDYFDYILPPPSPDQADPGTYVAIGDVSGKGVPAGLVMVMARSVLRSLASSWDADPSVLLGEVNRILKPDMNPGMFMSMLLGRTRPDRVQLCGCGHERPLVYRAATRTVQAFDAGGIVLGVVPDISAMLGDIEIPLAPGDQLLLYTDGVTEAMNPRRELYGLERLMRTFSQLGERPPQSLIEGLLEDIARHRAGAEPNDDVTLIALRRLN